MSFEFPVIEIPSQIRDAMIDHALSEHPNEACGLLSGSRQEAVEEFIPMMNALRSPRAFAIAPGDLLDFFRDLRRRGRLLTGIYHSHPRSSAVPSSKDVREFHYPGVSYWIASLRDEVPELRCYRWVRMGFQEQAFTIRNDE